MIKKLSKEEAKKLALKMGIDFSKDPDELGTDEKLILKDIAKLKGYKRSKSSSGSFTRDFFAYLSKK